MKLESVNEMKIPNDIESAVLDLKGLGELVTAAEWQRAALVYAFTYEGRPGGRKATDQECPVAKSMDEFAKLGLAGLSSRTTIRRYRNAWKLAIQDGFATMVMPGDLIALPEVGWDAYFNPPKPAREPSEAQKGTSTRSGDKGAAKSESGGAEDSGLPEDIDLDATKPSNKRARQGFRMLEGIETKRVPEKFRGGVERLKDGLTDIAQPGANYERLYLQMCQALGDLTAVLNAEEDAE